MKKDRIKKFAQPSNYSSKINKKETNRISLLGRIFGSQKELDVVREGIFSKYNFESNLNSLRILSILFVVLIMMSISLLFIERSNKNTYINWKNIGISNVPPQSILDFDKVINFSQKENFNKCKTNNPIDLLEGICDEPIKYVNKMNETQSRAQLFYVFHFIILFTIFFPLGTYFHRAIRNIKTLKYNTNISAEKSLIWAYFSFFIFIFSIFLAPIISSNFYIQFSIISISFLFLFQKVYKIIKEVYLGSNMNNNSDESNFILKNLGIITFRGKLWILLFIMTSFFNPSIISRLWIKEIITIDDLIVATDYMIYSSILMTSFAFISILFIIDIYKLQEIKRHLKGSITIDPLERS